MPLTQPRASDGLPWRQGRNSVSYAFRHGAESVRRNGSRNVDCILAPQTEELDAMSDIATIAELSTWANMRLASSGSPVDDILKDITEGETMKLLLESEQ